MTYYAHSGRSWQELREHLEAVAVLTSRLARKVGLPRAGELIGLAHDLGKYSEVFQQYLRKTTNDPAMAMESSLKGSVDHSTAGAQTIWRSLPGSGIAAEALALCVASHHSGLIDCILLDGVRSSHDLLRP